MCSGAVLAEPLVVLGVLEVVVECFGVGLFVGVSVVLVMGVTEGVGVGFVLVLFVGIIVVLVTVGLSLEVTVLFGAVVVLWQVEFFKCSATMTTNMQNIAFIS